MTCLSGSSGSDSSRGIIGIGMRMSVFQWRIRSQTQSTAHKHRTFEWPIAYCYLLHSEEKGKQSLKLLHFHVPECSWEKSPWCDDLWVPNFPISTCHAPRQSPEAALALAEEELAKAKQVEPAEHGASFWAPSGNLFETSQANSLTVTNRLPLATTGYHWLPLAYHESLAAKPELLCLDTKLKFSLGSQHYVLAVFGWLSAFFVQWIRC